MITVEAVNIDRDDLLLAMPGGRFGVTGIVDYLDASGNSMPAAMKWFAASAEYEVEGVRYTIPLASNIGSSLQAAIMDLPDDYASEA